MTDPQKDEATKRGDEILRRMLKTPPKPRKGDAERASPPKAKPSAPDTGKP